MPEQTVREQLVEALEKIARWHHGDHTGVFQDCRSLICVQARAAIERAKREPAEEHDLDTCIKNAQEAGRV